MEAAAAVVAGHRTGDKPTHEVDLGCGGTTEVEGHVNQRASLAKDGKAHMEERPRFQIWENRPSGIIGGPRKT